MFRVGEQRPFDTCLKVLMFCNVFPWKTDNGYLTTYIIKLVIIITITIVVFIIGCALHLIKITRDPLKNKEPISNDEALAPPQNIELAEGPSISDADGFNQTLLVKGAADWGTKDIATWVSSPTKYVSEHIKEVDVSEDITVISGGFGTILMTVFFAYTHQSWSKLLSDVLLFRGNGNIIKVENLIKRLNFYSKLYFLYYFGGVVIYAGATLKEAPKCREINRRNKLHLSCDTFVPIWVPFELSYYGNLGIFAAQFVLVNLDICPAAMICFLTFEITEIIALHLDNLKMYFEELLTINDVTKRRKMMGDWIRYHNHIISMSMKLRQLAKFSIGHITLISGVVFGCTENQLIKQVKPLGASVFLLGWMACLFLICHAGQKLMDQTGALADALFSCNWYMADTKTIKDMIIIILRAQKPIFLEALPLGHVNYALFVMIVRTSYSYLTLLNQTT